MLIVNYYLLVLLLFPANLKLTDWLYKSPLPLTDPRDAVPQAYTVLYAGVDGQCAKLVTDTVFSLSHWPST